MSLNKTVLALVANAANEEVVSKEYSGFFFVIVAAILCIVILVLHFCEPPSKKRVRSNIVRDYNLHTIKGQEENGV